MATPLRLGLIGAGRWGRNYIRTIAALDGVRLARLASRNPQSAQLVPADCRISTDWRAILDRREIDGVIIATPPALHAEMTRAAVDAGLPVLVEKPLTLNPAAAVALREFVAMRGGFVMVGHTHLFHPAFRELKHAAPRYGKIRAIRSVAGNHGPFRPDTPVLWDWGAHDVAMCLDLLGSLPLQISASYMENRVTQEGCGQVIELVLEFPGQVRATIRIGNLLPRQRQFSVHLDSAAVVYDDLAENKLVVHPATAGSADLQDRGEPVAISPDLPLTREVREFAGAISTNSRDLHSLDLGVQVVETLARVQASLDAGATSSNRSR